MGSKVEHKTLKTCGNILILACSQTKIECKNPVPAIHLYDGVNYRVIRKLFLKFGWPPGLQIKILSAKYSLIDATALIEPYDLRLNINAAAQINKKTLSQLKISKEATDPTSIFINLGKDYLPAIEGLESIFPDSKIIYADGGIGLKMQAMKNWLEGLCYRTSSVRGRSKKKRSYLYFFPDWDDFVYEPFTPDKDKYLRGKKTYAHEICSKRVPFDGILLSLSHLHVGKGALHRFTNENGTKVRLRARLRIPKHLLLFGDCGAFSYAGESIPPFTPESAAELYHKFGFDIGASVDHIPLPLVTIRNADGSKYKKKLSESTRYRRMILTRDNAEAFLTVFKSQDYKFTPLGVIQGVRVKSYVDRLHEYIDMGYKHIAVGGLVPRSDDEILKILCAIRYALQQRTKACKENIWIHLFGILRPKIQPIFKELGVSSFDSASYFRKAWLRSDQNYLAPDGCSWYGTIRVPISTSKRMRETAIKEGLSEDEMAAMESACLKAIEKCKADPILAKHVISSVNKYGPLLERRGEDNHFFEKHALLLKDRPWEKCRCPFCRSAGMHVVVFRGASRNKRRGLHNTWVFYHKVLHGKSIP